MRAPRSFASTVSFFGYSIHQVAAGRVSKGGYIREKFLGVRILFLYWQILFVIKQSIFRNFLTN